MLNVTRNLALDKLRSSEFEVSDLNDEIVNLKKEQEKLKFELENETYSYKKVKKERDQFELELLSLNLYSEKRYSNGILIESNTGYIEVLNACKKRVEDLEWQLKNCR
jgi:hypothetical protein